ncbi:MAG: hypothetical protein ACYSW4_00655 [Planctomycetota bacterium]|jgi:hypothetical protein
MAAGVTEINRVGFFIASTVSRPVRLLIIAGLVGWKGKALMLVIEKYFTWFSLAFIISLIAGFVVIKWLR